LEQDGTEMVAMLNTLTERENLSNLYQMNSIVPLSIEEAMNSELQAEERVVHTVMPE
jgi:hypothetical protein